MYIQGRRKRGGEGALAPPLLKMGGESIVSPPHFLEDENWDFWFTKALFLSLMFNMTVAAYMYVLCSIKLLQSVYCVYSSFEKRYLYLPKSPSS